MSRTTPKAKAKGPKPPARRPAPAASPVANVEDRMREACEKFSNGRELLILVQKGHRIRTAQLESPIDTKYSLGELILRMEVKKYDAKAIRVFAEFCALSPGDVVEYRLLAERYTREQLMEFKKLRQPNNLPLTQSHFVYAARIVDWPRRLALLKKAAAAGVPTEAFNRLVVEANNESEVSQPGRQAVNLMGLVRRLGQRASGVLEIELDGLDGLIDEVPPDKVKPETLEAFQAAEDLIDQLESRLGMARERLAGAHRRLEGILETNRTAPKVEAKPVVIALPEKTTRKAIEPGGKIKPPAGPPRPKRK